MTTSTIATSASAMWKRSGRFTTRPCPTSSLSTSSDSVPLGKCLLPDGIGFSSQFFLIVSGFCNLLPLLHTVLCQRFFGGWRGGWGFSAMTVIVVQFKISMIHPLCHYKTP